MRILKYELEVTELQTISLPKYGKFLCVQVQDGKPKLWIDEYMPEIEEVEIYTFGTGKEIDIHIATGIVYIGTYQLPTGFVGHVYKKYKNNR